MALLKPNGKIRPIAVGEVLRRLVAKCLCEAVKEPARKYFWPLQSGVAVPMGVESSIHVLRDWSSRQASFPDRVLLKLDFANAFNSVSRKAVLDAVCERFPQLLP